MKQALIGSIEVLFNRFARIPAEMGGKIRSRGSHLDREGGMLLAEPKTPATPFSGGTLNEPEKQTFKSCGIGRLYGESRLDNRQQHESD